MTQQSRRVYSTESGRLCPGCQQPVAQCRCERSSPGRTWPDGQARVRRETSGRKGKAVTTIEGLGLAEKELTALAKKLKGRCGSGGTVKNGIIEIQGDHRQTVIEALAAGGIKAKSAGG